MIKLFPFVIFLLLTNLSVASDCKTRQQTMLILDVIDVAGPAPKAIKDMSDNDIVELFESRIRNKLYVWIPENADVEVVVKGKKISKVKFGYVVEGYVASKDLDCEK